MKQRKILLRARPIETVGELQQYQKALQDKDYAEKLRLAAVKGLKNAFQQRLAQLPQAVTQTLSGLLLTDKDSTNRAYALLRIDSWTSKLSREKLLAHGVSPDVLDACTDETPTERWLVEHVDMKDYEEIQ